MDELDEITENANVDVGYFEGRQSAKRWLVSNEDLQQMYQKFKPGSEVALWCNSEDHDTGEDTDQAHSDKRKRKSSKSQSGRH